MSTRRSKSTPLWMIILIMLIVLGFISLLVFAKNIRNQVEPLADINSLKLLLANKQLPIPPQETQGEFHGETVVVPKLLETDTRLSSVLGETSGKKRIEVDLTNQRVYAFEGNIKVHEFVVSTGKWGATPTGEFTIWSKVRSQLMTGGRKELGTYYYLPNVPYVMFFYNNEIAKMRGFSFHGTYWHSNFGHPMSHGCINMKTEEAQTLYEWANPVVTNPKAWSTSATTDNPGTHVLIYGETPLE